MIAINEIRQIAQRMQRSGLENIEISGTDFSLRLRCDNSRHSGPTDAQKPATPLAIRAIKKGQFWTTHPMQEARVWQCGARVKAGDCLGFLQTGDLLLPVRSPQAGEIVNILASHGQRVGCGDLLYAIKPREPEVMACLIQPA